MWALRQGGWQAHFKKLFVYDENVLRERGGQQYWCLVRCWREGNMQRFDGML